MQIPVPTPKMGDYIRVTYYVDTGMIAAIMILREGEVIPIVNGPLVETEYIDINVITVDEYNLQETIDLIHQFASVTLLLTK